LPPYIYLPVKQTMHLKQRGLTLLEMMMGISIIGLTMTFVVPSAHSIFTQNRIISEINRTSSLLQYARLHAVETKQTITVCPASNFSTCSNDWSVRSCHHILQFTRFST
jgi:type IV fimbrial biogenesis protein FimT